MSAVSRCSSAGARHAVVGMKDDCNEASLPGGGAGGSLKHGDWHVRGPSGCAGQDRRCMKGVSWGVGGEDCHVVPVMRRHVGPY